MEYVQMTLNEWVEMKQKLHRELIGVKKSFVRIGFMLRQIDERKGYEQDGYKSIAEFAQKELGLHPSTTTRFMEINREYSIDGYSERLRKEYEELSRSQLEEMLKLPDSDRQMIRPETPREDIRELKRFNTAEKAEGMETEPAAGAEDGLDEAITRFYEDNPAILNGIFCLEEDDYYENAAKELINPSGNRSYRRGVIFMMMYQDKILFKRFGGKPQEMTWAEFLKKTEEIFGEAAAGEKTYENFFGPTDVEAEKASEEPAKKEEEERKVDPEPKPEKEKIAPAQKSADNQKIQKLAGIQESEKEGEKQEKKQEEEQLERQEIEETPGDDHKEDTEKTEERQAHPDVVDSGIKRIEHFRMLGLREMAEYIADAVAEAGAEAEEVEFWKEWLSARVDRNGRELEES